MPVDSRLSGSCVMQKEYAALDAVCLLMLLDNMIACAPPERSTQMPDSTAKPIQGQHPETGCLQAPDAAVRDTPLRHEASTTTGSNSSCSGRAAASRPQLGIIATHGQDSSDQCVHTSCVAAVPDAAGPELLSDTTADRTSDASASSKSVYQSTVACDHTAAAVERIALPSGQSADSQQECTPHQTAIQQAAKHWACRLEMSQAGKAAKPRARRHLSRRQRAHIRHAVEQQNQIDDVAGDCVLTTGFLCILHTMRPGND